MARIVTPRYLADVARGERLEESAIEVDPTDPHLPFAFAEALGEPMQIEEVERIEGAARAAFREVLVNDGPVSPLLATSFVRFFQTLGFLFKYKPYGVKIASPFGYSLFDLYDGRGFSFQLHKEPKLEAFHILRTHHRSFVYLSSLREWEVQGSEAADRWADFGDTMESPLTCRPEMGDVIRISSTELVHSVVGCTLEEYASCSVDAVERLLDQNARDPWSLPDRHPIVASLLQDVYQGLPSQLLRRGSTGWERAPLAANEPILSLPGQFRGHRIRVDSVTPIVVPTPPRWLSVIVPLTGPIRCTTAGQTWPVGPGGLLAGAPGYDIQVSSDEPVVVAIHSIVRDLVLREWTR